MISGVKRIPVVVLVAAAVLIIMLQVLFSEAVSSDFLLHMQNQRRSSVSKMVNLSYHTILPIISQVHEGKITRAAALNEIRNIVRKMTYTDEFGPNYIFMSAYDGVMLVQPFEPEKEGTNQWDLKDAHGKYIIRELVDAAKSNPSGSFVTYHYYPPDKKTVEEKLSYVIGIPEIEAYIGTGMYMEGNYKALHKVLLRQRLGYTTLIFIILIFMIVYIRELYRRNSMLAMEITERINAEEGLKDSEAKFRTLFQAANDAIFILKDNVFVDCNIKAQQIFQSSMDEIVGKAPWHFAPEYQPDGYSSEEKSKMKARGAYQGIPQFYEWLHQRSDGTHFYAEISLNRFTLQNRVYLQAIVRDVTERKQSEEQIKDQYTRLLKTQQELHEKHDELTTIYEELAATEEELRWNYERLNAAHEEKRRQQETIRQMAYFDYLTGLPNRLYLLERIRDTLTGCVQGKCPGAVMFIDMDNFKVINDTFGHPFGDMFLKDIADRLQRTAQKFENAVLGRLGGDEFVLFMHELADGQSAENAAIAVLDAIKVPFCIQDQSFHVSCSIGISLYPTDGTGVDELLKNADTAMYKAKEVGKNRFVFFNSSMSEELSLKLEMENNLRNAVSNNEFKLYYQPQIDIGSREIIGFEALLRWFSPKYGMVSPAKFISMAEETGIISDIGNWVIESACLFASRINKMSGRTLCISINVSPLQFMQKDFVDMMLAILEKYQIPSSAVGIEITETTLMESFDIVVEKLKLLREYGFVIHLDDFGTGYSSLNYLKNLPINAVKIDKSFISDITNEGVERMLVQSIIQMAHNIGLHVVAEGVETAEQLDYLAHSRCNYFQGYLFSRPVPEDEAEKMLKK